MCRLHIYVILLCCCAIGAKSQIFDFFQGLELGNPSAFSRPHLYNDVTTRRATSKSSSRRAQIYDQTTKKTAISYETIPKTTRQKKKESSSAPLFNFNSFFTTQKPRRKTIKNNNRQVVTNKNTWTNTHKNNEIIPDYPKKINTDIAQEISRPINSESNENNRDINNDRNNRNDGFLSFADRPFGDRPGVKPATVDLSQPPITNRPHNNRPNYDRPNFDRPTTERPYYERPNFDRPNNERPNFDRPSNERPNFDRPSNERPNFDRPSNERPNFDRPNTERPNYDRPTYTERPNINIPSYTQRPTERPRPSYVKPNEGDGIAFPVDKNGPEIISGIDEDTMSDAERRRYLTIAEQKCDQYKSLTTTQLQAIPLIPSPEPVQVNVSRCTPVNIPLIVGGKVVSVKEFPHMALIGWNNVVQGGYSWKCGGSLISDRFVLTAAHCAYQERDDTVVSGAPRVVQLGSSLLGDPRAKVVPVSSVIRHAKYKAPSSYYDLALLKLKTKVQFTDTIRPACLGRPPRVGAKIIATGWGRTQTGGDQSLELRSVSLPVWDFPSCRQILGTSRKLPNGPDESSQMCAGDKNGGKDTCQGDSGGPAQIQDGCQWRVVAVTSLGRSCGAPNTPGLYATAQIAFIAAHVFQNEEINNQPNNNNQQDSYYNNNNKPANNQNFNNNQDVYYNNDRQADTVNYNSNNNRNHRGTYENVQTNYNNDNYFNNYNSNQNRRSNNNYEVYRNEGPFWSTKK